MWAIFKREVQAYYTTMIGYVFMAASLLLSGASFALDSLFSGNAQTSSILSALTMFIYVTPILTMRLMSEERKNKSDQLLLTSPISLWSMVLGKYLAACFVVFLTMLLTGVYVLIFGLYSSPAFGEILCGYLGFFLMACCFIAIGLFISALTENQVVAAIGTLAAILTMMLISWVVPYVNIPVVPTILNWFSVNDRFNTFSGGVLGLSATVYMFSFALVFLFLTVRTVDRRRWS